MKQRFARLPPLAQAGILLVLAALYVGVAKLGLTMAPAAAPQVTVVWPATGLALAMILLLGYRACPAVFIGAFVANALTVPHVPVALGIAAGNTLEAVAAAWLMQALAGTDRSIDRMRDALGLVVCGAVLSTMISATIGVTSLCLGQLQEWSKFSTLWFRSKIERAPK
jgi:integral membrane sensor domain MASE1